MIRIYRWNGQYFGFINDSNRCLFGANSDYIGWLTDDNRVWRREGTFLGEVVGENYILRRTSMATPARKAIRATPARPAIPARPANRPAKPTRAGYLDALDEYA
jgi:hypothetical protein